MSMELECLEVVHQTKAKEDREANLDIEAHNSIARKPRLGRQLRRYQWRRQNLREFSICLAC